MILRRYGTSVQSVDPNFDSKAHTEIGFRRNHERSDPADEFTAAWERVDAHELVAETEGSVQDEVEGRALGDLEGQLRRLESGLGPGEVLVVENEQESDHPKTHTVAVEGENRLHFRITVRPALRVGVYRKRGGSG